MDKKYAVAGVGAAMVAGGIYLLKKRKGEIPADGGDGGDIPADGYPGNIQITQLQPILATNWELDIQVLWHYSGYNLEEAELAVVIESMGKTKILTQTIEDPQSDEVIYQNIHVPIATLREIFSSTANQGFSLAAQIKLPGGQKSGVFETTGWSLQLPPDGGGGSVQGTVRVISARSWGTLSDPGEIEVVYVVEGAAVSVGAIYIDNGATIIGQAKGSGSVGSHTVIVPIWGNYAQHATVEYSDAVVTRQPFVNIEYV